MSDPTQPDVSAEDAEGAGDITEKQRLLDRFRGTGVGVEDPNIVGDPHPGIVEEQVAEDEPPQV